jgi:hypothetical protein
MTPHPNPKQRKHRNLIFLVFIFWTLWLHSSRPSHIYMTLEMANQMLYLHTSFCCVALCVQAAQTNMFCFSAWLGASLGRLPPNKLQVFSKIGGNLLGVVVNPCFSTCLSTCKNVYRALRTLQDQVALLLPHDYLPARYLAIFVESSRLTKPDFPFVKNLDLLENSRVLQALHGASRIDVMYDEVDTFKYAKHALRADRWGKNLSVNQNCTLTGRLTTRTYIAEPELEIWGFDGETRHLEVYHTSAETFGDMTLLRDLTGLCITQKSKLLNADFQDLVVSKLAYLSVILEPPKKGLDGVEQLTTLQSLTIEVVCNANQQGVVLPPSVSRLVKLRILCLQGNFCGVLPTEIGMLSSLRDFSLVNTSFSSTIPTEIGQLSELINLTLYDNKHLQGSLPTELNYLTKFAQIRISSTPLATQNVMRHGLWLDLHTWRSTPIE